MFFFYILTPISRYLLLNYVADLHDGYLFFLGISDVLVHIFKNTFISFVSNEMILFSEIFGEYFAPMPHTAVCVVATRRNRGSAVASSKFSFY